MKNSEPEQKVAYESGSELYGEASLVVKVAAERDPRLGQFLIANLHNWYAYGGDLIMHYGGVGRGH